MSGRRDRRARFRARPGSLTGARVALGPEVARHMQVMRLEPGAVVFLFDGEGAEAQARLVSLSPGGAEAEIIASVAVDAEPGLRAVLVQAVPVKVPRMDTIVQQCTEIGVSRIVPVLSRRGPSPRGGAGSMQRKVERWRRIAESAAQQCGRATVPEVDGVVSLTELRGETLPAPRLMLHPAGRTLSDAVSDASRVDAVTLLVGPEGGWTDEEVATMERVGVLTVRVGPRVLRADTAGAVALSLVQYEWGDLG